MKEIRNNEKRGEDIFFKIVENSADAIACVDLEGKIVYWNKGAEQLFGYSKKEILGKNFHILVPEELRDEIKEIRNRVINEKAPVRNYETYRIAKSGEKIPVSLTLSPIEDNGRVIGICGIFKDITTRKKLEDELKIAKESLEAILDAIKDCVCVIDKEMKILAFNKAFLDNFNIKEGEGKKILGEKCYKVFHDYDEKEYEEFCRSKCIVETAFEIGEFVEDIHKHEIGDKVVYHYARAFPIKKDKIKSVVYIFSDFTDKKRTEEELRKKLEEIEHLNRLKELFASILAHDLMSPLTVVKNILEMLVETGELEKSREIEIMLRNIDRAIEIVESAALFAKIKSKKEIEFREINLVEILKDEISYLERFAENKKIKIKLISPEKIIINASDIIAHVFINLISNAIKYSPENSEVIVVAEENEKYARVYVKDYGEGIKDEYKELIFERFKRLEKKGVKGTGLGLAIAKEIADLHNAKIWVEDNKPRGSIFIFEIPKNRG